VSVDERPVALPKLYGAPAYARPPVPVAQSARPFDPDLLPLQVYQTDEDRRVGEHLTPRSYIGGMDWREMATASHGASDGLRPRLFNLRAIAGRLLGGG
jgi:hypothetical protein